MPVFGCKIYAAVDDDTTTDSTVNVSKVINPWAKGLITILVGLVVGLGMIGISIWVAYVNSFNILIAGAIGFGLAMVFVLFFLEFGVDRVLSGSIKK